MKRNSNIIHWTAAGFLTLVLLLSAADAVAGMAVSPLQQWVEVKPGKDAFFSVTVTNTKRGTQTKPCTISMDVLDFTVSPQGGLSFGRESKHDRSAVSWISFDDSEFVLEPGQSRQVKAKLSAPVNADGDYWAAIMVRLKNPKNRGKGVQVNLQTASGVFIHVARRNHMQQASIIDANVVMPEFAPAKSIPEEPAQDQSTQEARKKQALKINTELKNDGLVTFLANGKAFLYSTNQHRIASIPLYTSRRRIFPGHTRRFTGVMSQPLPAGQYRLRVFFEPDSKYGRKITRDIKFSVSDGVARRWAENFTDDDIQTLQIQPQQLNLTLTPGRFTAVRFSVANQGLDTVSIHCGIDADEPPENWLTLKSSNFTLAQNTRRSVVCLVRIPKDTEPGQYSGTIRVEVERSGLTAQGKSNIEIHKIPICIAVNTPDGYAANK